MPAAQSFNRDAARFAASHDFPTVVGSDAHLICEVGNATLELPPFSNASELRQVIRQGVPHVQLSPWRVHTSYVTVRAARLRKRLGWGEA